MGAGPSHPASQQQRRPQPALPPQYYPPAPYSLPPGSAPQAPYGAAPYPYGYAYYPQPAGGQPPSPWAANPQYPPPAPHPHAAPWYGGYPGHAPPPYQVPVPPMMQVAPPPVVAEPQQAVTIRNEVNVKRSSLRLERDPEDPRKHLVAFAFDATVSGSLSVFIAAAEGEGCSFRELYPSVHTATVVPFAKGLGQKFVQPPGTGVDLSCIPEEHLFRVSGSNPVYPLVIRTRVEPRGSKSPVVAAATSSSSSDVSHPESSAPGGSSGGGDPSESDPGAPLPRSVQSQMTYAVFEKVAVTRTQQEEVGEGAEGEKGKGRGVLPALFAVRPVKQKIWVDGTSYEVQEIYGIEQCGRANTVRSKKSEGPAGEGAEGAGVGEEEEEEEEVEGKECVICMSAPRDTTVLPCRHMCMCADCAKVLRYQTNKCPICRQPVQSLLEIRVPPRLPSLDGPEPGSPQAEAPAVAAAAAAAGAGLTDSQAGRQTQGEGGAASSVASAHAESSHSVESEPGRVVDARGVEGQGHRADVAELSERVASVLLDSDRGR